MFKKIGLVCLLLLVGSVAFLSYYWSQFTAVPKWYQSQENSNVPTINLQDPTAIATAQAEINSKIQQQLQQPVQKSQSSDHHYAEVKLNEQDFNQLLVTQILTKVENQEIWQSAQIINSSIQADKLAIGTTINPGKIPVANLPEPQQKLVQKAIDTLPMLKNQNIYLGIEGKPTVEQGRVTFADDTKIKVGNLSLTIDEVAQKLGVSPNTIKEKISLEMQQTKINNISIEQNEIILKIATD